MDAGEPMIFEWAAWGVVAVLLLLLFFSAIRIFREYERGVMFTLGRYTRICGPGFVLMIPVIQQMVRTDLRTFVEDVPPQDVISHDNVSVKVNAVHLFPRRRPAARHHPGRGLPQAPSASWPRRRCARCWASTIWTRCWPSATS